MCEAVGRGVDGGKPSRGWRGAVDLEWYGEGLSDVFLGGGGEVVF